MTTLEYLREVLDLVPFTFRTLNLLPLFIIISVCRIILTV